jgi:hypothetical protein
MSGEEQQLSQVRSSPDSPSLRQSLALSGLHDHSKQTLLTGITKQFMHNRDHMREAFSKMEGPLSSAENEWRK